MGRIKSLIRLDFYEVCTYTDEEFEERFKELGGFSSAISKKIGW